MMPPASARRPEAAQITALAVALESRVDRAALTNPNPGSRPFQRLNRAEYGARGEGHARHRRRRRRPAAGRHDQQRLRQRRRRAGVFGDADGELPARRREGDGAGDWRQGSGRDRNQLPRAEDRVAAVARRRRAVRHARRHLDAAHVPGRRRLRVQGRAAQQRVRRAVRRAEPGRDRSKSPSTASARRS